MRADERDIGRYFRRKVGISKVRDVILLRDKRTGRHKGCAYVEVGRLEDVDRALGATGKIPDFQRFPILVKRAEAEKSALALGGGAVAVGSLSFMPPASIIGSALLPVQLTADGMRIESQKVYVGSIDPCVTQTQLRALFSQFGTLEKVLLQTDAATGMSRGFGFLTYRDPKDANLAIQTMSGQMLAGRPL
jgi:RNA-binding protein 39